jgi:hypothetical protein
MKAFCTLMVAGVLLFAAASVGQTQSPQQEYTLNVNGQLGMAKVVQVNGHSYVDLEALGRIANATITYQGNQIQLMIPGTGESAASAKSAAASQPVNAGFSKDFVTAGIEYMSQIREWRNTLRTVVEHGYPLSDDLFAGYRAQADTNLDLVRVAASTQADRNATQLLVNEYENMLNLTQKYLTTRAKLEYIDPQSIESDPVDQKVLGCARSLAAMASDNQFHDDGPCH